MPSSCAQLGGFEIGARVSLLWQHSAERECQRVLVLALCLVHYSEQGHRLKLPHKSAGVRPNKMTQLQQDNRRLHIARAVHSRHPLPGDRRCGLSSCAGGRPRHGHGQHTQKFGKYRACGSGHIFADRQTDILITILGNRSRRKVTN